MSRTGTAGDLSSLTSSQDDVTWSAS